MVPPGAVDEFIAPEEQDCLLMDHEFVDAQKATSVCGNPPARSAATPPVRH